MLLALNVACRALKPVARHTPHGRTHMKPCYAPMQSRILMRMRTAMQLLGARARADGWYNVMGALFRKFSS